MTQTSVVFVYTAHTGEGGRHLTLVLLLIKEPTSQTFHSLC
jgi:hypothetical protein